VCVLEPEEVSTQDRLFFWSAFCSKNQNGDTLHPNKKDIIAKKTFVFVSNDQFYS
jgi:hypothetical protein